MKKSTYLKLGLLVFLFVLVNIFMNSCTDESDIENSNHIAVENNDSVYVYNIYGIAQYKYNADGKLSEILSLDPITLTPFITDSDKYECKYTYDDNGYICDLIYFGKRFSVNKVDELGRTLSAVCNTVEPMWSVNFTYDENDNVIREEFFEGNNSVLKTTFDSSGKPTELDYHGTGTIRFTYTSSETYVMISLYDASQTAPDITITFDESGYPKYFLQSLDGAMSGTTWYYNEQMLCFDTLVESSYEGSRYTEEYVINYNNDKSISDISYYVPDNNQEPVLYSTSEYKYNSDGSPKTQIDIVYNGDEYIDKKTIYGFVNGKRANTTTETYTDGSLESKEVVEKVFDSIGREKTVSTFSYDKNEELISGSVQDYEFNSEGYVTERKTEKYSQNNVIENTIFENYEFDDVGNKIKATYRVYNSENILSDKEIDTFEYNKEGNITIQTVSIFDASESLVSLTKTENKYAADGTLEESTVTQYDAEGNVVYTKKD